MRAHKVIVIGSGVGGLAAAARLAARGIETLVLERAPEPGGKLREIEVAGRMIDAGPTVLTMRDVFDELFESAGTSLDDHLKLKRAGVLARHAWSDGSRLDLTSDVETNAHAIEAFAGATEAAGYRAFAKRGAHILETLDPTFMRASRPNPLSLASRVGWRNWRRLTAISPFETLWDALGNHFKDPRLRQLFGRYATYCGSSPFLAPATLMLIAETERRGVWFVEGGMRRIADALRAAAERAGARFRFGTETSHILVEGGRARGVETTNGQRFEADAVVFNGDVAALHAGLLGDDVRGVAAGATAEQRSLSAVTWVGVGEARGFPLLRHTVFFSGDYAREFDALIKQRRLPAEPTAYVCASDREDDDAAHGPERLFVLVNAPPARALQDQELRSCETAATDLMRRCGLSLAWSEVRRTTPAAFAAMFPATGGALYGPASHGWRASFQRPAARSRLPGLYLAGGSVHPGPGLPMAALSGKQAALALISDLASTRRFVPAAMPGGMSTPSAKTSVSG